VSTSSGGSKILKLSKWTYTQLRVLIVSGGNKAFREYMEQYDLMHESVQKRYNTVAAQYYRDLIKNKIKGGNHQSMIV
jgi:uridylate kinase